MYLFIYFVFFIYLFFDWFSYLFFWFLYFFIYLLIFLILKKHIYIYIYTYIYIYIYLYIYIYILHIHAGADACRPQDCAKTPWQYTLSGKCLPFFPSVTQPALPIFLLCLRSACLIWPNRDIYFHLEFDTKGSRRRDTYFYLKLDTKANMPPVTRNPLPHRARTATSICFHLDVDTNGITPSNKEPWT